MKKHLIITLISIIHIGFCFAQNTPPGIAYQAVAIKDGPHALAGQNANSFNWSNKEIQVRFSIFDKYPGGSVQYSEVHSTKTDEFGVFNLIIGQGKTISGIFDNVPWELGTAHLQVEIDFENNNNFKVTSFERFWSVPYAFVTRKTKGLNTDSAISSLNDKFTYLKNRDKDTVIGNEGGVSYKSLDSLNNALKAQIAKLKLADKDTVIGNEWQNLSVKKDSLLISNGKGVKLIDNDSLNEIQKLTRVNDTVSLSKNGGKFVLNDDDPKNELQDLTLVNDSIGLTKSTKKIAFNNLFKSNSAIYNQIDSNSFYSTFPVTKTKSGIYYINNDLGMNYFPTHIHLQNKSAVYILEYDINYSPIAIWKFEKDTIYKHLTLSSVLNGTTGLKIFSIYDSFVYYKSDMNLVRINMINGDYIFNDLSKSKYSLFFGKLMINPINSTHLKLINFKITQDTMIFLYNYYHMDSISVFVAKYSIGSDNLNEYFMKFNITKRDNTKNQPTCFFNEFKQLMIIGEQSISSNIPGLGVKIDNKFYWHPNSILIVDYNNKKIKIHETTIFNEWSSSNFLSFSVVIIDSSFFILNNQGKLLNKINLNKIIFYQHSMQNELENNYSYNSYFSNYSSLKGISSNIIIKNKTIYFLGKNTGEKKEDWGYLFKLKHE